MPSVVLSTLRSPLILLPPATQLPPHDGADTSVHNSCAPEIQVVRP
jgi:hypothetical protein